MKVLGLDIGTTSISAVVVEKGTLLARITRKNDSFIPSQKPWERIQSPEYIKKPRWTRSGLCWKSTRMWHGSG